MKNLLLRAGPKIAFFFAIMMSLSITLNSATSPPNVVINEDNVELNQETASDATMSAVYTMEETEEPGRILNLENVFNIENAINSEKWKNNNVNLNMMNMSSLIEKTVIETGHENVNTNTTTAISIIDVSLSALEITITSIDLKSLMNGMNYETQNTAIQVNNRLNSFAEVIAIGDNAAATVTCITGLINEENVIEGNYDYFEHSQTGAMVLTGFENLTASTIHMGRLADIATSEVIVIFENTAAVVVNLTAENYCTVDETVYSEILLTGASMSLQLPFTNAIVNGNCWTEINLAWNQNVA